MTYRYRILTNGHVWRVQRKPCGWFAWLPWETIDKRHDEEGAVACVRSYAGWDAETAGPWHEVFPNGYPPLVKPLPPPPPPPPAPRPSRDPGRGVRW